MRMPLKLLAVAISLAVVFGYVCQWVMTPRPHVAISFQDPVWAMAFNEQGTILAVGDFAGNVRIYQTDKWSYRKTVHAIDERVECLLFQPDTQQLLVGGRDGKIRQLGAVGDESTILFEQRCAILSLSITADGRKLCSTGACSGGAKEGEVIVWNMETHRPSSSFDMHSTPFYAAISPDGRSCFTIDWDGLRCWDIATGKQLPCFDGLEFRGKTFHQSSDGTLLAVNVRNTRQRTTIQVLSTDTGQSIMTTEMYGDVVTISHDNRFMAVADNRSHESAALPGLGMAATMQVFEVGQSSPLSTISYDSYVYALSFSPDGKHLVVAGGAGDGYLHVYDIKDLR